MAKTFRPRDVDQSWVLPLSVHEFAPQVIWRISLGIPVREAEYL
jgi:hypothetical protein